MWKHGIAGAGGSRAAGATWSQASSHNSGLVRPHDSREGKRLGRAGPSDTHLENLFRMRPAGVTSKNDMGDLKIAVAILSCNLRDAYANRM